MLLKSRHQAGTRQERDALLLDSHGHGDLRTDGRGLKRPDTNEFAARLGCFLERPTHEEPGPERDSQQKQRHEPPQQPETATPRTRKPTRRAYGRLGRPAYLRIVVPLLRGRKFKRLVVHARRF